MHEIGGYNYHSLWLGSEKIVVYLTDVYSPDIMYVNINFVGSRRPSASKGTKRTQSEDTSAPNAKV